MNAARYVWLALLLCQQWPGAALAARLLTAAVECNEQCVLRTAYQDDGRQDAAIVWQYLDRKPLWSEGATTIVADAADPLKATLQGKVMIRVQHGNRIIVAARTDTLCLARTDSANQDWFLAAGEIERIGHDNGLKSASSRAVGASRPWQLWFAGFVVAAGAIFVVWTICSSGRETAAVPHPGPKPSRFGPNGQE
jgi:hypothetical protein